MLHKSFDFALEECAFVLEVKNLFLFVFTIANGLLWLWNWVVWSGRMVWLRLWVVVWLRLWVVVWLGFRMVNRSMVITGRMCVICVATWWCSKTGETANWNDMFIWVFVMMFWLWVVIWLRLWMIWLRLWVIVWLGFRVVWLGFRVIVWLRLWVVWLGLWVVWLRLMVGLMVWMMFLL